MYVPLTFIIFFGILFTICIGNMIADPGYDDKNLYEYSKKVLGIDLVCPVERYENTPKERLELVCFYESELGQSIYSQRRISIEPLIEHIKSVFRRDQLSVRGFQAVSAIVLLSVLLYQIMVYYNCKTKKINPKSIKYMLGTGWYDVEDKIELFWIMTMPHIREWLASQAAAGYINYNPIDRKYFLSHENAMVLAYENSPTFILGAYQVLRSIFKDEDKFIDIFKSGKGLRWGEHHHDLFEGTAKFFKPNYMGNLVQSWIPSLEGVEEKLKNGAKVADIGCGYGIPSIIMAKEYPN